MLRDFLFSPGFFMDAMWSPKKRKVDIQDRISSLPDAILHQVLSLINTREAVQTCVLSKRWRYLWTSITNINIQLEPKYWTTGCSFQNFVNNVLSLRDNSNVDVFRFHANGEYDYSSALGSSARVSSTLVEKCMIYAVKHNVQCLDIDVSHCSFYKLPECFFTCESLKVLKLAHCYVNLPKSLCIPSLKTLILGGTCSNKSISMLVSSCLNLEILVFDCYYSSILRICAPKLRSLELLNECSGQPLPRVDLLVDAPRLTSIKFEGCMSFICTMGDLPYLDKVYIDLRPNIHHSSTRGLVQQERLPKYLIRMLRQLRNAKSVTLSMQTLEILALAPGSFKRKPSPFQNLKHLKFLASENCTAIKLPLDVVFYLIKKSNSVDTMVVELPTAKTLVLA